MSIKVNLKAVYMPSEDVVARDIQGELIIVPIVAGIGDLEDSLFSLDETGKVVWRLLDGKRKLEDVVKELGLTFTAAKSEIRDDVLGFVKELLKRGLLVEVK